MTAERKRRRPVRWVRALRRAAVVVAAVGFGFEALGDEVKSSAMTTPWGENGAPEDAWTQYPRPQLRRDGWTNLNGIWDYALVTNTASGVPVVRKTGKIRVPFCFESVLSGAGCTVSPQDRMIYRRTVDLHPKAGRRILLNFEAVDYSTQVFLNGVEVTDVPHEGGNLPFTVDLTPYAHEGANALEVRVWDPTEWQYGGRGKQSASPAGCFYTRVSGIWQTVWLEEVPSCHVVDYVVDTDVDAGLAVFRFNVAGGLPSEASVELEVFDGDRLLSRCASSGGADAVRVRLPEGFLLWSPDHPQLYTFRARVGGDVFEGYFAMRKVSTVEDRNGDRRFALNDEAFYPLATLDQGWWPDGLLTPPCEAAMEFDVRTLKAFGFNAMRKHIKVEPRRYYYLCDKIGLAVFQDLPSGFEGRDYGNPDFARRRYGFSRAELKEMIDHLRNVPSIVAWVPYNEGWGQPAADLTRETLRWTKRYDPTRLVDGPSGWNDWEPNGRRFNSIAVGWGSGFAANAKSCLDADGKPSSDAVDLHSYPGPAMPGAGGRVSFLGEYGGLGLKIPGHEWKAGGGWGYAGTGSVTNRAATQARYLELLDKVRDLVTHGLAGSVYTQTADVENEINGLITYDRRVLKFDADALRRGHERVLATARALGGKGWLPAADGTVDLGRAGRYRLYVATAALARGNPKVDGREVTPARARRDASRQWTDCGEVAVAGAKAKVEFSDLRRVVFMPVGDPLRPPETEDLAWRAQILGAGAW